MITGSLNTLQRTPLPAPLDRILVEVVQSVDRWRHAPLGKQEVDGLKLFCLVSEELTEPAADRRGEFHQQYLDIQLLL
ncbi:YhcH/YjgK/YiaL family protein, partial [Aeromonas dhakensis]